MMDAAPLPSLLLLMLLMLLMPALSGCGMDPGHWREPGAVAAPAQPMQQNGAATTAAPPPTQPRQPKGTTNPNALPAGTKG